MNSAVIIIVSLKTTTQQTGIKRRRQRLKIHTYICTYYVQYISGWMDVHTHACACTHTCRHTFIHSLHSFINTHTYTHSLHRVMDGHMHTSAHTCVHTYTHTHSMHKQTDTYKRIATLDLCLIGDADLRKYHSTMGGTDEIQ